MFYRYISENLTNYINAGEQDAGSTDFDYAKMADAEAEEAREGLVEEKCWGAKTPTFIVEPKKYLLSSFGLFPLPT